MPDLREPRRGGLLRRCQSAPVEHHRLNLTACTVLDCDNAGILLRNVTASRISDCLIRDDRPATKFEPIVINGGSGNMIADNLVEETPGLVGETSGLVGETSEE